MTTTTCTPGQILDVLILVAAHGGEFMAHHVPNEGAVAAAALLAARDRGMVTIEGWTVSLTTTGRAAVAPWT